jgi:hypothetical protein
MTSLQPNIPEGAYPSHVHKAAYQRPYWRWKYPAEITLNLSPVFCFGFRIIFCQPKCLTQIACCDCEELYTAVPLAGGELLLRDDKAPATSLHLLLRGRCNLPAALTFFNFRINNCYSFLLE